MSKHVWLSERLTIHNIRRVWQLLHVRPKMWDDGETSLKRDILYWLERGRQDSGRSINAKRRGPRVTDKHAELVVNDLVLKPAGVRSVKQFIGLKLAVLERRLLSEQQEADYRHMAKTLTKVFRVHPNRARVDVMAQMYKTSRTGNYWKGWRKVHRGRDFFVKGLGSFDLAKVDLNPSGYYNSLPSVAEIQVVGYLNREGIKINNTHYLEKILSAFQPYFVKWFHQLLAVGGGADEIYSAMAETKTHNRGRRGWHPVLPNDPMGYSPEQMLEYIRECREARHDHTLVPDDFEYPVSLPNDKLEPVRTYGELKQVAKELHNCAGSYHDSIANEGLVMLVLRDGEGKAKALGAWNKHHGWEQIAGPCNEEVAETIRMQYDRYANTHLQPE